MKVVVSPPPATVVKVSPTNVRVITVGTRGQPGQPASVAVGDVTTGDPGTPAEVTNVGTSLDAVFDFVIPRGFDGGPHVFPIRAGMWGFPRRVSAAQASTSRTVLTCFPIWPERPITATDVGAFVVGSPGASSATRLAFYANNAAINRPTGALLAQATIAATATGWTTASLSAQLAITKDEPVWLFAISTGTDVQYLSTSPTEWGSLGYWDSVANLSTELMGPTSMFWMPAALRYLPAFSYATPWPDLTGAQVSDFASAGPLGPAPPMPVLKAAA